MATQIGPIKPQIYADNKQKILTSLNTFDAYVDKEKLRITLLNLKQKVLHQECFSTIYMKERKNTKSILFCLKEMMKDVTGSCSLLEIEIVDITILGDVDEFLKRRKT